MLTFCLFTQPIPQNCNYSIIVVAEAKMSGASSRQSQMVADEMFPDGPGPLDFVDVEDGVRGTWM